MQYFKWLTVFLVLSTNAYGDNTNEFDLTQFQNAAIKAVEQAQKKGWLKDIDAPELDAKDIALAKQLADQAVLIAQSTHQRAIDSLPGEKERVDLLQGSDGALFISFSMPRRALIDSFKMAEEHNLTILLRGLEKGATHISSTMKLIQTLSAAAKVEPNVGINPLRFTEFNVTSVPTIVLKDLSNYIVAPGTLNVDYVKEQFKSTQGNSRLEPLGQLFEIDEPDMIEQMKTAAEKIDWKKKQIAAKQRFWKKYKMHELPTSLENKQWLIDPSLRVTKDIKNAEGEVLARAGETTNPLKRFPMQLSIFVINPYIESQLVWLKEQLSNVSGQFQVHLTHMDKDNGWDDLAKFREQLGAPMFILPKQAIDKFKLQATPSKVQTQTNGFLLIQQFDWSKKI